MILLALTVAVCCVLWFVYKLFRYRKRSLASQIVLITGGGGGLGRGAAVEFGKLGCSLVLWDVAEQGLKDAKAEVEATGAKCDTYVVDITNREMVYQTAKKVGRVDILVNNAGIVHAKPLLESSDDMLQKTIDVNCTSHLWTIKAFLPGMIERRQGHITTVASVAGIFPSGDKLMNYHASKGGALLGAEALYLECRDNWPFIKTTVMCPFFIKIPGDEGKGLFAGTKSSFVPILEMPYVVDRLVEAVQRGEEKVVIPWLCWAAQFLKPLPAPLAAFVMDVIGVSKSMRTFTGKTK